MSDDHDDDATPDKVGYRRPPKSGRFRKGQSGNPRGRPRKQEGKPSWIAAQFPTSETLRAEARRMLTINGATGRQQVNTTEAIVRALALSAMRGGVLAQRTYLEYQKAEDERFHKIQKERFEFWEAYQIRGRKDIATARQRGLPEPDWLPHPDDIELNHLTLDVKFLGAMDEEGRDAEKHALTLQRLGFEMAIYLDEDNCLPSETDPEGRIGIYFLLHQLGRLHLPPRLRIPLDTLEAEIMSLAWQGMKAWGDDLERRCAEGRVPFIRAHATHIL